MLLYIVRAHTDQHRCHNIIMEGLATRTSLVLTDLLLPFLDTTPQIMHIALLRAHPMYDDVPPPAGRLRVKVVYQTPPCFKSIVALDRLDGLLQVAVCPIFEETIQGLPPWPPSSHI